MSAQKSIAIIIFLFVSFSPAGDPEYSVETLILPVKLTTISNNDTTHSTSYDTVSVLLNTSSGGMYLLHKSVTDTNGKISVKYFAEYINWKEIDPPGLSERDKKLRRFVRSAEGNPFE